MSHLFTQWGTGCTPKIESETEQGKRNIFGWHVKSDLEEYNAEVAKIRERINNKLEVNQNEF